MKRSPARASRPAAGSCALGVWRDRAIAIAIPGDLLPAEQGTRVCAPWPAADVGHSLGRTRAGPLRLGSASSALQLGLAGLLRLGQHLLRSAPAWSGCARAPRAAGRWRSPGPASPTSASRCRAWLPEEGHDLRGELLAALLDHSCGSTVSGTSALVGMSGIDFEPLDDADAAHVVDVAEGRLGLASLLGDDQPVRPVAGDRRLARPGRPGRARRSSCSKAGSPYGVEVAQSPSSPTRSSPGCPPGTAAAGPRRSGQPCQAPERWTRSKSPLYSSSSQATKYSIIATFGSASIV